MDIEVENLKTKRRIIAGVTVVLLLSVAMAAFIRAGPKETILFFYDKYGKRDKTPKPPKGNGDTGYKIIAKWKDTTSYYYNPQNPDGLSAEFIAQALGAASNEWDSHTGFDLVGESVEDRSATFGESRNGKNEICFGDYSTSGVIAVCRVWVTRGKPSKRRIVEFDLLFDTDYTWGDSDPDGDGVGDPTIMDLQSIATHELGHGIAGLDDIYESSWSHLTMYGYSHEGDVGKRTIEGTSKTGDIGGVKANYGK